MERWRTLAAANNAEWCDVMARAHGRETRFTDDAWSSATRSPPFYPDAVTLVPTPSVPELLARIDASAGCSIKDSFSALDLSEQGFRVLFDAQWIARPYEPAVSAAGDDVRWQRVQDAGELAAWERAWRGEDGPEGLFRPDLLEHPSSVAVLAAYERDEVVAGAVCNRSETVVGVSNYFTISNSGQSDWSACLRLAQSLFPAQTAVVGYESGDALIAARRHRFEDAGPLRIWIRDGSPHA